MKRVISLLIIVFFFSNLVAIASSSSTIGADDVTIVGIGNTGITNLTLDSTPQGLSGYNISISLSNSSVVTIASVTFPSWAVLHSNSSLPASSLWLKAADLNKEVETGATNVLLATLALESVKIGETSINVSITKLDDDSGYPIEPGLHNATASVVQNQPPYMPNTPNPTNSKIDVSVTSVLKWNGGDPNPGDTVTYDVYFGTTSFPSLKKNNQTSTSYNPGTLVYSSQYYWKIIAWDNNNVSNEGPIWTFTTRGLGGGGGGNGGGSLSSPTYYDPIADVSAGEPYNGNVDESITFDGSNSHDPDGGTIISWYWEFGDGINGTGKKINYSYSKPGPYLTTLTVTDDENAVASINFTVSIIQPNRPPSSPIFKGNTSGTKNTTYPYDIVCIDLDNDTIKYTIDWGDKTTPDESDYLPNGTKYSISHSWVIAGKYTITVTSDDNQTTTQNETIILIDARSVGDIGYITDDNADGTYDKFHDDKGLETDLGNDDGKYLIDSNGDGEWDYTYDLLEGVATYKLEKEFKFTWILITGIVLTIALLAIIIFAIKRR